MFLNVFYTCVQSWKYFDTLNPLNFFLAVLQLKGGALIKQVYNTNLERSKMGSKPFLWYSLAQKCDADE